MVTQPQQITATPSIDLQQGGSNRATVMRQAYLHYIGQPPPPLKKRSGEPDDNIIVSLGRTVVDKGVSFLFGQEVVSHIESPDKEAAQDWLNECWRRNKRMLTLQKLAQNGGICGHAFIKIVADGIRGKGGATWPRLIVIDPQQVAVVCDPDDCDHVLQYIIGLPDTDEPSAAKRTATRRQVILEDRDGASWQIVDQHFQGGAWVTDVVEPWPHDFAPVVDCQNLPRANDFWGESDLPMDLQAMLRSINRVVSHINKIVRVYAHPKVWARGMGTRTIDVAIDAVIQMPSETAELNTLEMKGDLAAAREFLGQLNEYLSVVCKIPLVALGVPDQLGSPSGVALQIRYQPLLEKTEQKRLTYGVLIQELDRRLLALAGFGDQLITQQNWHEMLPTDPLMERQVLVLDDSLGVRSKRSIAEALDLDYDSELEQMEEEADQAAQKAAATGLPLTQSAPGQPQPPAGEPAAGTLPPGQSVPPPAPLQAPVPDIARSARSR